MRELAYSEIAAVSGALTAVTSISGIASVMSLGFAGMIIGAGVGDDLALRSSIGPGSIGSILGSFIGLEIGMIVGASLAAAGGAYLGMGILALEAASVGLYISHLSTH